MIVIVEGYDCSGKSSLCKQLSKELNAPIYKTFGERKIDRDYSTTTEERIGLKRKVDADLYLADFLSQVSCSEFISDRGIFSYLFYECHNKEMLRWWLKKTKNLEIRVVFCKPNLKMQKIFLKNRGLNESNERMVSYIAQGSRFLKFIKESCLQDDIIIVGAKEFDFKKNEWIIK